MQGENDVPMLHGVLLATVYQAENLAMDHRGPPNRLLKLCTCSSQRLLEDLEKMTKLGPGLSRLYATIDLGTARVARTRPVKHAASQPTWNESFRIYCAYETHEVTVLVRDELTVGAVTIGKAKIPAHRILSGQVDKEAFELRSDENPSKVCGQIRISLQFKKVTEDLGWGKGIRGSANLVPHTYFKEASGNKITLYQDTHTLNEFKPKIPLSGGRSYVHARCWEDLFRALSAAEHLIYIAGWSVYTRIMLVRDTDSSSSTLGDLLKTKAHEGVTVLLLVWDDRTSVGALGPSSALTAGVMHTHDEDTRAYFRGSKVHCVLCPRNPDNGSSIVQGLEVGLMFTHHQKAVVVDVEVSGQKRKLVSFIGGIDLCDGRYDTQNHSLFKTLNTVHKADMHQPNFEGASLQRGGPREPWHDVHVMIDGPAAWDVLTNFEQRWRKQASKRHLLPLRDGANKRKGVIYDLLPQSEHTVKPSDPESWKVQIFRSIDEGGVDGFPKVLEEAADMGLVAGKENIIERSIQDAYICAIRRAEHFIYMENQYFLGSSAAWNAHNDVGAIQLIPMELTLKIISKIEAGERFAVYIVVPMWPEGVPESESVQDILNWQRLTLEMMYKRIAKALRNKRLEGKYAPTDYLNFFCLGNRESQSPGEYVPPERPREGTDYYEAQEHRRFMIYVHAKTMIVDDEYIIVGSANCNQRSMDGARDSEIAMGAYQPYHVFKGSHSSPRPRGQIHGFRMSLWYEHLGRILPEFQQPESNECVKKVQSRSQELWRSYTGQSTVDMDGHLMPYPIQVERDGTVTSLSGFNNFPDTRASVLGQRAKNLPPILTT